MVFVDYAAECLLPKDEGTYGENKKGVEHGTDHELQEGCVVASTHARTHKHTVVVEARDAVFAIVTMRGLRRSKYFARLTKLQTFAHVRFNDGK